MQPSDAPVQQIFSGMPARLYPASPSRLLAWLDCPRRYRMQYLDRPRPVPRPPRAHTSVGVATHNALRDFWDLAPAARTPTAVQALVRRSWIDVGFRDPEQSATWRVRTTTRVTEYLRGIDRVRQPLGVERTVSLRTQTMALTGRVDRLDDRDGALVVVDYKTDHIAPEQALAQAAHHAPQLQLYGRALAVATGASVRDRLVLFTALGESVAV